MTLTAPSPSGRRVAGPERRSRLQRLAGWVNLPLAGILVLQLGAMLSLQNTPFQDEALYLYAGHRLLDNVFAGIPVHESFAGFFSGLPYFYPVIGGVLDSIGGYELARALSTICVLFITFAAFRIGRTLFGGRVGLLTAAICAAQASLIFVGRLATYDAFSFALFAAAAMIAVETTRRVGLRTVAVIVLCCLAVAAKYAVALVVPAALLMLWLAPGIARDRGARVKIVVTAILTLAVVGAVTWLLLHNDQALLKGLTQTTTARSVSSKTPLSTMLSLIVRRDGIVFVLAIIGLVSLGRWGVWRRTFVLSALVVLVALLIPAYHAYAGETTSVDKHLGLTAFLLSPLAGLALDTIVSMRTRIAGWVAAAAILIASFSLAIGDARALFHNWPNSTALHTALLQTVRDGSTRVLSEEVEVPQYYLVGSTAQYWQFTGLDFMEYTDKAGQQLTGAPAYEAAIREGYFGVIVFRYGPSGALDAQLEPVIKASGLYDKVASLPFTISGGKGAYTVWRRDSTPAPTTQKELTP